MKVLGLDLSSHMGYALLSSSDKIEHSGVFHLKNDKKHILEDINLLNLAKKVGNTARDLYIKHRPDLVIIEQTNAGSFRTSQKFLEFSHFSVLNELHELNANIAYVDTSAWRRTLGIKLSPEQRKHNKSLSSKKSKLKKDGKVLRSTKGNGKITWKHLSVAWVNDKFKLELKVGENDIADAICVASYAYATQSEQVQVDLDKEINSWKK